MAFCPAGTGTSGQRLGHEGRELRPDPSCSLSRPQTNSPPPGTRHRRQRPRRPPAPRPGPSPARCCGRPGDEPGRRREARGAGSRAAGDIRRDDVTAPSSGAQQGGERRPRTRSRPRQEWGSGWWGETHRSGVGGTGQGIYDTCPRQVSQPSPGGDQPVKPDLSLC